MSQAMTISLRPVSQEDEAFILSLYASTREEELARLPWTLEQKTAFVKMQFAAQKQHYAAIEPGASHEIILRDGVPAGRLYLARKPEVLHILDVTISPQHRSAGVGGFVLRQILSESCAQAVPVSIYVEFFNPSIRFFERLGFRKGEQQGVHFLLAYSPAESARPK
jgi:RimJ/RimL family protein N-acetyltransferase